MEAQCPVSLLLGWWLRCKRLGVWISWSAGSSAQHDVAGNHPRGHLRARCLTGDPKANRRGQRRKECLGFRCQSLGQIDVVCLWPVAKICVAKTSHGAKTCTVSAGRTTGCPACRHLLPWQHPGLDKDKPLATQSAKSSKSHGATPAWRAWRVVVPA